MIENKRVSTIKIHASNRVVTYPLQLCSDLSQYPCMLRLSSAAFGYTTICNYRNIGQDIVPAVDWDQFWLWLLCTLAWDLYRVSTFVVTQVSTIYSIKLPLRICSFRHDGFPCFTTFRIGPVILQRLTRIHLPPNQRLWWGHSAAFR